MQFTFTSGLYLVGMFQGIFLVMIAPRHTGRPLLIIFLAAVSLLLSDYLIWENGWLTAETQWWINKFTHSSLMYLIGPSFYFYVQTQFKPNLKFGIAQAWHLVPYLLSLVLTIFILPNNQLMSNDYGADWKLPPVVWPSIGRGAHLLIYALITGRVISNTLLPGKKSTSVQRLLIVILVVGFCISLLTTSSYLVDQASVWKLILKNGAIIGAIGCTYLVNRLFISLASGGNTFNLPDQYLEKPQPPVKYQHSAIDHNSIELLYESLIDYMKTSRPYENPDLSLPQLAQSLSLTPNKLSQVINQRGGLTFYEFISLYRIEAACQLLVDKKQDHLSIEGIGYQVGFRSKSTFYEAFKRLKGCTPKQYKDKWQ